LTSNWRTREKVILEAMLERGSERVPIPDTGSLERDLFAYAKAIADNATDPDVQALVRAVASIGDPESLIVEASRSFWQTRLELARAMVERAAARGEIPDDTDPSLVVEAVVALIYFRLLMSRKPLHTRYLRALARAAARGAGVRAA
jgi:Tetracyclin repressor-like, C-terminal domain